MNTLDFFLESALGADDAVVFATVFQTYLQALGREKCWCLRTTSHVSFSGFSTAHPTKPRYKALDARPLVLAVAGMFAEDADQVIVRRWWCDSLHCINPAHLYFGTRGDVAMEQQLKKKKTKSEKTLLTPSLVETLKKDKDLGISVMAISRKHRVPYHVARRVCNEGSYKNRIGNSMDGKDLAEFWNSTVENCVEICKNNPTETRNFNLSYHMAKELTCPWHQRNGTTHKGNFGLMGECLDCMEEIKMNRCSVDVTQFNIDWYWQVKRFWEQVDIKDPSECWPWKGPTRRDKKESVAYFPSPMHTGTAHSASRVAFWLSRGYTGKYRVFSRNDCSSFCCNPLHLSLAEVVDCGAPTEISSIKLNHTNVLQHYKKSIKQNQ
jgi:hypothetical protein